MSPKIISLESYSNIVSSYTIFVTYINTFLVKFKVIYQQAFAHNTHGLFHHKQFTLVCATVMVVVATYVSACLKNYIIGNYVQIQIKLYNLWRHAFIFY